MTAANELIIIDFDNTWYYTLMSIIYLNYWYGCSYINHSDSSIDITNYQVVIAVAAVTVTVNVTTVVVIVIGSMEEWLAWYTDAIITASQTIVATVISTIHPITIIIISSSIIIN